MGREDLPYIYQEIHNESRSHYMYEDYTGQKHQRRLLERNIDYLDQQKKAKRGYALLYNKRYIYISAARDQQTRGLYAQVSSKGTKSLVELRES